jgi:hypothetical protein
MKNLDPVKVGKALFYLVMFIAAAANIFGIDVPVAPTV